MVNLITPATIQHDIYDKISDDIYLLGKNVILRFNINLSKDINNNRVYFHKEFQYPSKYNNNSSLITIRRNFDFYFTIENIYKDEDTGIKEFIRLGITEIMLVQQKLYEVLKWFTDKQFETLYARKGKDLIMLGRADNIKIANLPMDKYLIFEAIVCIYETNSFPGVRLYLSSSTNYIDMSVDKFMGFYYLLTNINMYESAQLMINYLERPDNGTNITTYKGNNDNIDMEGVTCKEGRLVTPKINNK